MKYFNDILILKANIKPIRIKGRLYYCYADRGNTLIRLKREIREIFSDFNEKDNLIEYTMEYYRSFEELFNRLNDFKEKGIIPLLLNFYKKEKE